MTEVRTKRIDFTLPDGSRVAGQECGPETGDLIVLIAGWPQTLYAWRHVQLALANSGRRSLAIDPPGLGDSDVLAEVQDYATPNIARLMSAALSAAGIERYVLVGHDVGAWIAYAWACAEPQRVSKLVLLDAAIPGAFPDGLFKLERAAGLFQFFFNAVPGLPERLTRDRERVYLEWIFEAKTKVKGAVGADDIDAYMRNYGIPNRMSAGFNYYRAVPQSAGALVHAARLSMPVLALGAEGGVGTALRDAMQPRCDVLVGGVIAGSGHFIPEEAPAELTARLLEFVGGQSV